MTSISNALPYVAGFLFECIFEIFTSMTPTELKFVMLNLTGL